MHPEMYDTLIISANDPYRTAAQLSVLGFEADPRPSQAGATIIMREVGQGPAIEIHEGGGRPKGSAVFFAIDIYSSNAKLTADLARKGGWVASEPTVYWAWGLPIIEAHLFAEYSGLAVLAAQTDAVLALPSRLDAHPEELHTGVKTAVFFVEEAMMPAEIEFWTGQMGFSLLEDVTWYDAGSMSNLLGTNGRRIGGALFVSSDRRHTLECLFLEGGGLVEPSYKSDEANWCAIAFPDNTGVSPESPGNALLLDVRPDGREERYRSPAGIVFHVRRALKGV